MSPEPRIASLCTGTGMLDQAVMDLFGGTVAWHCQYDPDDKHQFAAHLLRHHWPDVPNLGDMTAVDWAQALELYGRPDILTAGFPCQDVSAAGLRAGITDGTRSGLWAHVALAVSVLRPRLVVIENVEGLLSAPADRGLGLDDEALDEEAAAGRILRALGAVLGDLADLGFDAEWVRVAASDVGAPHRRHRIVILAWDREAATDTANLGHEWARLARQRWDGPEDRGFPSPNTHGGGRSGYGELPPGRDSVRQRLRDDAGGCLSTPANPQGIGRDQGRTEPAGQQRGSDDAQHSVPPVPEGFCCALHGIDWDDLQPAIERWDRLFRPVPWPVDDRGRLNPQLSEWMMGMPAGWVTNVPAPPGMSAASRRNAYLKAIGNGVVRPQMVHGIGLAWSHAFGHDLAQLHLAA